MNKKVYQTLRIICCIIAAIILAATVFIFVYLGTIWGIISLAAAGIFAVLTFLFKAKQESEESKDAPKRGDFITGAVETPNDENKNE
ncbi:MAG: hypothetical protein ACI4L9_06835 [Candidatus Coproplasma sp.]